jgi:hypothetical protein
MKIIFIHNTTYQKEHTTVAQIAEGLYEHGVDVIASHLGNGIKQAYSEDEILEHSKDADFIFYMWAAGRGYGDLSVGKEGLVKRINRPEITVYIDGSEWNQWNCRNPNGYGNAYERTDYRRHIEEPWLNREMFDYCKWYFKTACFPEDESNGAIPFPLGCDNIYFETCDLVVDRSKKYDIFCSFGQYTTGLRPEIYNFCRDNANKYKILSGPKVSTFEYFSNIIQSYIVPSSWGGMVWSMREWEILASGSMCFVHKIPLLFGPHKPKDGVHWVEYSDMNEFEQKLEYYLDNKDLCLKIGKTGKDYALKYHSSFAKVKYILDIIGDS